MTTQMYNAEVEVDRKAFTKDADIDAAMDKLAHHHPALSGSQRGWATARISLPAESLAQATATAAAIVENALGGHAIACEVMTETEFNAREGWDTDESELVSASEAATLLGVTRQRVNQLIAMRELPATKVGRYYSLPRSAVLARVSNDD